MCSHGCAGAPTGMSIGGVHGKWGQTARHRPATVTCESGPWKAFHVHAHYVFPPRCAIARDILHAIFITRAQRSLPSHAMAKVAKRLGANTAQDCDRNTFMITWEARAGRANPTHTSTCLNGIPRVARSCLWGIPCVHCRHHLHFQSVSDSQSFF